MCGNHDRRLTGQDLCVSAMNVDFTIGLTNGCQLVVTFMDVGAIRYMTETLMSCMYRRGRIGTSSRIRSPLLLWLLYECTIPTVTGA